MMNDRPTSLPTAADSLPSRAQEACELTRAVLPHLRNSTGQIRVLCTAADADPFVAPFLEELERAGLGSRLSLLCSWNQPVRFGDVALSPASRTYSEPFRESPSDILLLVQSGLFDDTQDEAPHLHGVSTAKTNITHALDGALPDTVIVASAVSGRTAFETLLREFPEHLLDRFVAVTLQIAPELPQNLTFAEFRDMPELVRIRRTQFA